MRRILIRSIIAILFSGVLLSLMSEAKAGGPHVGLVGHIGGPTRSVFVRGNYAYEGEGSSLVIMNIANPAAPIVVGRTAPLSTSNHLVEDIDVAGDYAYVADFYYGLRIMDVSNPLLPSGVGVYNTPGWVNNVEVVGHYAYLVDRLNPGGLRIINISNPRAPSEVGFYDTPGDAFDLTIAGSYAYIADGGNGLRIINISNPAAPTEVGFYDPPGRVVGVAVAGSYAYAADLDYGLRVINISNPTAPTEVDLKAGLFSGVLVSGRYVYVISYARVDILDITNPAAPTEVGFIANIYGGVTDVAVTGHFMYTASGYGGVYAVDISNPALPTQFDVYKVINPNYANGVTTVGGCVYVAEGGGGLEILCPQVFLPIVLK